MLESRVRYEGYIRRESERVERLKPLERPRRSRRASTTRAIPGLSREVVEKCAPAPPADARRGLARSRA